MEVANSPSRKRSRREYEASNEKSTRDSPRRISPRATRQAGSTRDAAIIIPSPSPTEKSLTLDAQNKPEIVTIPSDDPLETPDLSAPPEGESTHNDSLVDQEFVGEFNCPVCFELICMAVTTACGHSFCRPCLEEWLDGKVAPSRTCPACRTQLRSTRTKEAFSNNDDLDDIVNSIAMDALTDDERRTRDDRINQYVQKLSDKFEVEDKKKAHVQARNQLMVGGQQIPPALDIHTRQMFAANLQQSFMQQEMERQRQVPLVLPPNGVVNQANRSKQSYSAAVSQAPQHNAGSSGSSQHRR